MRLLLDTNVILDVLLNREPHVGMSSAVWTAVERRRAEGFLATHAITTIHYLYTKHADTERANGTVAALLKMFSIAAVNQEVIEEASELDPPDFEDAVTACAAHLAGCEIIVTRDPRGFRKSKVRALAPEAALPLLS